jgi:pentatricopeptide repeat protein
MYGGRIFGCGPFSFSLISAPSLVSSLIDKKICLFLQSQVVYNSLINAYANSKQPDKARKIFEDVQTAGLQPDMVSSCP